MKAKKYISLISILHTDGSTETRVANLAVSKYMHNMLISFCTALRKNDLSIAAVKINIPGYDQSYSWVGNSMREHDKAIAKAERENLIW